MIRKMLLAAAVLAASCPVASAGTGTAEFFGSIRAAGTVLYGSGISSSGKFGIGRYEVFFPRNIDTCALW